MLRATVCGAAAAAPLLDGCNEMHDRLNLLGAALLMITCGLVGSVVFASLSLLCGAESAGRKLLIGLTWVGLAVTAAGLVTLVTG